MNKNYYLLFGLLIALSGGLLFLPEKTNYVQESPENLMWDIVQPTRYISTDQVAKMIIEKDPLFQLVDVRMDYDFEAFSLPNSFNIPIDSILTNDANDILNIEDVNTIFLSDDDIKADQAWVIAKRMGYNNVYVMKGGLNCWIRTIIQPQKPSESAPITEFELYNFRKGASIYFTGVELSTNSDLKQEVNITRKKKETVAEGGC
ncbi:MAG: rhodanese-like domain-containing protein [Bacteroidetes bacterium]|nr:rhodanese-like domain-containing protein [Bacteroidota bacterium]